MSRFTDAALAAAALNGFAPYHVFFKLEFDSGTRLFSSMRRSYTFDGDTYTGPGALLGAGQLLESDGTESHQLELVFGASDAALMTTCTSENYHLRPASAFWAYYDPATEEPYATPENFFEGYVDVMAGRLDRDSETILVVCEDEFERWNTSIGLRMADEDQKSNVDATDRIFNLQHALVNKQVFWGRSPLRLGRELVGQGLRMYMQMQNRSDYGLGLIWE